MRTPAFANGQLVTVALSKQHPPPQGAYRVVAAMPLDRGGFQYRIKGDEEKYERVIDERHLAAQ